KILSALCAVMFLSVSAFGATMGELNALASAKLYLSTMAFSYSGLVKQLEDFEGYSHAEAEYAVKNCGADWNEQAAKKAKEYLDVMPFSRRGLMDQLVQFEGFTKKQAEYGVKQNGY
ncbi:MAG: Ltp family lipoprotein, partial [Synergistaceae bacterium]|nr:Ltp family lipoprotein [Synergistaceae bacterium]